LKKLLMIFLMMNFAALMIVPAAGSQPIQEIIDPSQTDAAPPETVDEPTSAATAPSDNLFALQTGTFFSEADANAHIIKLKEKGLEPYIFQSVNSQGKTIYAARIGQYESYADADQAARDMKDSIDTPLLITHFDSLTPAAATESSSMRSDITPASVTPAADLPPEKSAPAPAETAYVASDEPLTMTAMQRKLQAMEVEIQKLRDESDIRSQLKITEEEQKAEEEDILEAAGREYTLTQEGNLKFSYGISYSYSGYDAIRESVRVEDVADHTISNSLSFSYGLKDNFTVGTSIPFIYAYHKVGTVDSLDVTDFGDLSLSWQLQPYKPDKNQATMIFSGGIGIPVGRDPYEIQVGKELSTASGLYSANLGVSLSQVTDPMVAFSSLSVNYPFATKTINQKRDEGVLDEVDPGMSIGAAVGLGYALSYKLNLNLSFSYSYGFETTYKYENAPDAKSGTSTGASLSIGTGYKLSQNQNLNFSIGIPITSSRSFSLSLSTPIDFEL